MNPEEQSSNTSNLIFSNIENNFRNDIIKETLKSQFVNSKTKITDEAVELVSEIIKALVVETSLRASKQATLESKSIVTLSHVESVLPQIMLDFP